jgi:hypothetical protein
VNHLVRGGSRMPWLTEAMIDYVAGRRSYGALRRDVLLRSPGTAIRLLWKRLTAA